MGLSKKGENTVTLLCKKVTRCKMDLDKLLDQLKKDIRNEIYEMEE